MKYVELKIQNSQEAIRLIREALTKPRVIGYEQITNIFADVRSQFLHEINRQQPVYLVDMNLRLLNEFFNAWQWFGQNAIQPEDMDDVLERAFVLIPTFLEYEIPASILTLAGRTLTETLEKELNSVPGFTAFMEYARVRFDYLANTPKYFNPYRGNPPKW